MSLSVGLLKKTKGTQTHADTPARQKQPSHLVKCFFSKDCLRSDAVLTHHLTSVGAAQWREDERPGVNWPTPDRSGVKAKAASGYRGQLTAMCSSLTY